MENLLIAEKKHSADSEPVMVDLERVTEPVPTRVFSLYEWGRSLRVHYGLDALELSPGSRIKVRFPIDTLSVTCSFFNGMFEDSIRRLRPDEFKRRYEFVGCDWIEQVRDRSILYVEHSENTGLL